VLGVGVGVLYVVKRVDEVGFKDVPLWHVFNYSGEPAIVMMIIITCFGAPPAISPRINPIAVCGRAIITSMNSSSYSCGKRKRY